MSFATLEVQKKFRLLDERVRTANSLLYSPDPIIGKYGNWMIYKTTRSGGSTGIMAEMINECKFGNKETFCAIVPTTRAAMDTVISGASMYAGMHPSEGEEKITLIPANIKCIINDAECDEYPSLKKLPLMPLGDRCIDSGTPCEHFEECPVTRILRDGYEYGVVLTQHKLAALMLASTMAPKYKDTEPSIPTQIINSLSTVRNVIFDEAHKMEYDDSRALLIANMPDPDIVSSMGVYRSWIGDMPYMTLVLDAYEKILASRDVKNAVMQHIERHKRETKLFKSHGSITLDNPIGYKVRHQEDEDDEYLFFIDAYKEIIRCMKYARDDEDIKIVLELYTVLCIIMGHQLHVANIRICGKDKIFLTTVDTARNSMTGAFLRHMERNADKRIILMSATFGSMDYKDYIFFRDPIQPVLFGPGGDPLRTNDKMLIISSGNRRDQMRIYKNGPEIEQLLDRIIAIKNKFETNLTKNYMLYIDHRKDNVNIITTSARHAKYLEKKLAERNVYINVDYYNSVNTIAVACASRVLIAIGCAEKPMNAYDMHKKDKTDAMCLRKEMVHADTWQAWSRVKDPHGRTPSVVFAFYTDLQECVDLTSWGFGRNIEVIETDRGFEYKTCIENQCITSPKVVEIRNFEDIMAAAVRHVEDDTEQVENIPDPKHVISKPRGAYHNQLTVLPKRYVTLYTKQDLLEHFVVRWDAYYKQLEDGSYTKYDDMITADLISRHISGDITIGVLAINPNHPEISNCCHWICIDIDAHIPNGVKARWINAQHKLLNALYDQYRETNITIDELNAEEIRIRAIVEKNEKEYLTKKRTQSEEEMTKFKQLLLDHEIPYILEASGTPGSYHFWIFIRPCEAIVARQFGKDLIRIADISESTELNPKQNSITKANCVGYGNQVKMPLGLHRKHGVWSTIEINGEFVRDFTEITIGAIDVTQYKTPFNTNPRTYDRSGYFGLDASGVRPIFKFGLTLQLTGQDGHNFRVAAVREFSNNGMDDEDELVNLFRNQEDFNPDKTRYHVRNILQTKFGCWKKETIEDKCGEIVEKYVRSGGKW